MWPAPPCPCSLGPVLLLPGLLILLLFAWLGQQVVTLVGGPVPGSVVGMLIFLPFLRLARVRAVVEAAAELLLRHLALFFVPACTGLVLWLDLLTGNATKLALVLVISTWLGMAATAGVMAMFRGREERK